MSRVVCGQVGGELQWGHVLELAWLWRRGWLGVWVRTLPWLIPGRDSDGGATSSVKATSSLLGDGGGVAAPMGGLDDGHGGGGALCGGGG